MATKTKTKVRKTRSDKGSSKALDPDDSFPVDEVSEVKPADNRIRTHNEPVLALRCKEFASIEAGCNIYHHVLFSPFKWTPDMFKSTAFKIEITDDSGITEVSRTFHRLVNWTMSDNRNVLIITTASY